MTTAFCIFSSLLFINHRIIGLCMLWITDIVVRWTRK